MTNSRRLLYFSIFALAFAIATLHFGASQADRFAYWPFLGGEPFLTTSNVFFCLSLLLVAFWGISARKHPIIWLWGMLLVQTAVHYCATNLLPVHWISANLRIYQTSAAGLFGYMILVGTGVTLLHLYVRDQLKGLRNN